MESKLLLVAKHVGWGFVLLALIRVFAIPIWIVTDYGGVTCDGPGAIGGIVGEKPKLDLATVNACEPLAYLRIYEMLPYFVMGLALVTLAVALSKAADTKLEGTNEQP